MRLYWIVPAVVLCSSSAFAGEFDSTSQDTAWVILTGALVFFMQAGFALLESGMARTKNAVNVMMKNYMDVCIASLIFWAVGYGLMFGTSVNGFWGTDKFLLSHFGKWEHTTMFFQIMFASTAATICSGAMAERTKFSGYLIGALFITGFIYPVYGSWVWNPNGWLNRLGFIDFAGSTVVHSIGAWCALAGIIVLGPRLGRFPNDDSPPRPIPGHNLTSVALGGFILWLGWFGFNAGSTLAVTQDIGLIALNTHLSAAAGAVGAMLVAPLHRKPILLTGTVNGSIAGLVGITAGCASMEPAFAVVTGFVAGVLATYGAGLLDRYRLDDVVGAIPVHGIAGVWGTLAAGLFFTGDLFSLHRVGIQLLGIVAALVWALPLAMLGYSLIDYFMGIRSPSIDEQRGLDVSEHAEAGYPEFHRDPTYRINV